MHSISEVPFDTLASPARVLWRDFLPLLVSAAILLVLVSLGELAWFLMPLRWVLGLFYTLFVPGYCLTVALFTQADDLDGIARAGMSFGLSVALAAVLALVLSWLPWGIRPWPILCGVYGEIAIFIAVAIWRRSRLAPDVIYTPKLDWHPRLWWHSLPPGERHIHRLLAGALLLASLWAIWALLFPSPDRFTTEFYILGKAGLAQNYPREVAVGDPLTVTMGITNQERNKLTYRVEIWAADSWNRNRSRLVMQNGPITVEPGHSQEWPVTWRMPSAGDDQQVEFLLFTEDSPQPYRRLHLWLNVTDRSPVR